MPKPRIALPYFATALAALLMVGCSRSGNVESSLQKAKAYMEDGNYPAAEIEYKNVLRADNRNPEALANTGKIYFEQGRYRIAFPYLNATLALDPDNVENRVRIGNLFALAGQRKEARDQVKFAIERDPANQEAPLLLVDMIDSAEALQEARGIIGALPPSPAALVAQGSLSLRAQNFKEADAKFDAALAIDPNFAAAYTGKFALYSYQKKPAEADAALRKAAEMGKARSGIPLLYAQYLAQQKGDLPAASAYMASVLEKAPDYLPAIATHAEQLAQQEKIDEAKKLNEQALKLDPTDATALRLKGVLLFMDKKYDASVEVLRKMLELYPRDIKANYQIALAYLANKDKARAKPHLESVTASAPGNLEAAALLSSLQIEERDLSGAVITLKRLAESQPNSAQAKVLLAEVYNKQGNHQDALAIYQQLESAMPNNPELDYLSGLTLLQGADRARARESFESALQANPLHLQSVEQLTALDLGEKDFASALRRIDNSIAAAPTTAVLYVIRGQILGSMGKVEESEASYLKAIELDPANRMSRTLLSRQYRAQKQNGKAVEQLQSIIERNPDDITALAELASIKESEGKLDEAMAHYEQALKVNPDFLPALNNLSYLISSTKGATPRAIELAEKARAVSPNDPYTADTLGWILYQNGNYGRARALLSDSVSKLGQIPEVQYHFGSVNYALGDEAAARPALAAAIAGDASYVGIEIARARHAILMIDPAKADEKAIALLEQTIKDDKKDPVALYKLGQIELGRGDAAAAQKRFEAALKIVPDNLAATIGMAQIALAQGRNSDALEYAKSALRIAPANAAAISIQAQAAFATRDYAWASSLASGLVRQNPNDAALQLLLAKSALAVGQLREARAAAQAIASLPAADNAQTSYAAKMAQALAYLADPAGSDYAPAAGSKELHDQLAAARQARSEGNATAAEGVYETVLKDYPDQPQAQLGLASILVDSPQKAERAFTLASEARKKLADNPECKALQGIARFHQGQFSQSAQYFGSIAPSALTAPSWKLYYGLALQQSNDAQKAEALLNEALAAGLDERQAKLAQDALAKLKAAPAAS